MNTLTLPQRPREIDLGYDHASLRLRAMQYRAAEKVLMANTQQKRVLGEVLPDIALAPLNALIDAEKPIVSALGRELPKLIAGSPLGDWISETRGLSKSLVLLLGSMPPLNEFWCHSAVWKYVGLHVSDGRAVKRERGKKTGFNLILRAYAIARVATPIVKVGGPYRGVYDLRKAATLESHPPMLDDDGALAHPDCEFCDEAVGRTKALRTGRRTTRARTAPSFDCANLGGPHWTAGHRHADAQRVIAKAVLRDAWRVVRGMPPLVVTGPSPKEVA